MTHKPQPRHGVLMLMVLIILAMFVLLVLTYLLTSGQAARIASHSASSGSGGGSSPAQAQLQAARIVNEVVAGSTNVRSPFYQNSLLEDMWGEDTRPFSGIGIDTGEADSVPYALQWNPRGWLTGADYDTLDSNFLGKLAGGLDEDYDAPDYRNPALAMMDDTGTVLRPSFHDPWLINYLISEESTAWNNSNKNVKRRVFFRPLTEDHTDFDGSNTTFDPVAGPWDIDNDGDGKADSVWIYAGDPVQTASDGSLAVPLYAILLVDLDGRLNVNLHSHGTLVDGSNTGFGMGPAEISLHGVAADHANLISSRHGTDSKPGSDTDPTWQLMQNWTFPAAAWTAADLNGWGSPHDLFGLGTVTLGNNGSPTYATLSDTAENPYRVNVNTGAGDEEFTFSELERVLRPGDIDSGTLPQRLATLLDSSARYTVTTHSADSTAPGGPYDPASLTNTPPSLANNQRIPLNMRFGDGADGNTNSVVDEEGPAETELAWWATGDAPAAPTGVDAFENITLDQTTHNRTALVTRMFDVAMDVTPATCELWADNTEKERYLGQWMVNIVDFRDRDSIMTKFTTPAGEVVWGCESPHMVISETVCFHDRATRDTDTGGAGDTLITDATTPDDDNDQIRRPRGSLFVELKNRDSDGESLPGELYELSGTDAGKLDLARTTPAGDAPVWRLAITVRTPSVATLDNPNIAPADVERAVYFIAKPTTLPTLPAASIDFWAGADAGALGSGEYCTIGPEDITYYGTRTQGDITGYTNNIDMDSITTDVAVEIPDIVHSGEVDTRFSATEPVAGYAADAAEDGTTGLYATAVEAPFDDADADLQNYGTIDDYKVVHLQRLANPLIAWDETDNPYITVDSMPLAMTVYTAEEDTPGDEASAVAAITSLAMKFDTRDRDGDNDGDATTENNIWKASHPVRATGTVAAPLPNQTLGAINAALTSPPTGADMYPWFTWNDRPYMSRLELLLVPHSAPQKLLADHSLIATTSPYVTTAGAYGHLINLFNRPATAADRPQLHRFLEYVDVQSLFAGTRVYPAPASGTPQHPSYYGVGVFGDKAFITPGRVNINTLSSPVWTALLNGMSGPTYDELADSRQGYADADSDKYPTAIARPFRSFAGNANVADGVNVPALAGTGDLNAEEVEFTLLRSDGSGTPQPLFANDSNADGTNTDRNPYFRYRLLNKLGSTVTNRSHVFACWVTVGYFEAEKVTPSAAFPEGIKIGQEVGSASGNIVRNRSFYVIDRSRSDYTGSAFVRGDESQLDNVIVLERPIE